MVPSHATRSLGRLRLHSDEDWPIAEKRTRLCGKNGHDENAGLGTREAPLANGLRTWRFGVNF